MPLYPLKFESIFKYRIWGGEKLKTHLGKDYSKESIGESWELSDIEGDESVVENGNFKGKTLTSLLQQYTTDILGKTVYDAHGDKFPLLLKFIDAKTPLSIQVHPNDEIAKIRNNSLGKSEMWYVMQSDDNGELIVGFKDQENKASYKKAIDTKNILPLLNSVKVKQGDTFYIPAGRIHAIGAGVLLAEIQQTSDITYRIYDYDRVDPLSNKQRDLHTDQSLDVIDFKVENSYNTTYLKESNTPNKLVHSPFFKTDITILEQSLSRDYSNRDSFVIYMCVEGSLSVTFNEVDYTLKMGEVLLLPACINTVNLTGNAKILEVYM